LNALVPQNVQLPAHLQQFAGVKIADKVGAIAMPQPPSISLFQAKFWLVDAQGNSAQVMAPFLDVVIVDMNQAVSKIFYAGTYDPNDTTPPTCHSDNGVGASSRATAPQHTSCQLCPQNQWGSKISQMSQKPIKACTDAKKLAVALAAPVQTWANGVQGAANAAQSLYMLRVPAASLKAFGAYVDSLNRHGVDPAHVVTRLQFDPAAGYPSLLFSSTGFISAELAPLSFAFMTADKAEERRQLTGENDVPWQGQQLNQPVAQLPVSVVAPAAPTPQQPLPSVFQPQPGYVPLPQQVQGFTAPPSPGPIAPMAAPPPFVAPPATVPPTPTATPPAPPPAGTAAPAPRKRGRPAAQQAPAATAAPSPAPTAAPSPFPPPAASPAAPSPPPQQQVVMAPAPPPGDLAALLQASLGTPPASPPQ
jgi:hypothetical protein